MLFFNKAAPSKLNLLPVITARFQWLRTGRLLLALLPEIVGVAATSLATTRASAAINKAIVVIVVVIVRQPV
jgi:hypothetical protein